MHAVAASQERLWFEPWMGWCERRDAFRERAIESPTASDVIVFGMGRYCRLLVERLGKQGVRVSGVDFDPGLHARSAGKDSRACWR